MDTADPAFSASLLLSLLAAAEEAKLHVRYAQLQADALLGAQTDRGKRFVAVGLRARVAYARIAIESLTAAAQRFAEWNATAVASGIEHTTTDDALLVAEATTARETITPVMEQLAALADAYPAPPEEPEPEVNVGGTFEA